MLALGIVRIIAGAIAIAIPVIGSLAAVAVFGAVCFVSDHTARLRLQDQGVATSAWYGLGGALYAIAALLVCHRQRQHIGRNLSS